MKKLILAIFLTNFLVACASNKPKEEAVAPVASTETSAPSSQSAADAQAAVDAQAAADAKAAQLAADELDALNSKSSVYFPFDVDAVQAADRETILKHAQYLAAHPGVKVRVEGNADERGSSEYNLALGQRRAENTKRALVLGGAEAKQIETISYGEEKPRASGHDEASWSQNRRADINYGAQ